MSNSPIDFVSLVRVVGVSNFTEATVARYLCSQAKAIEERTNFCPHCATRVKPWEPAIFEDGKETGRQKTEHKWCPGCHNVVFNMLIAYMNVPDTFRA